MNGNGEIMKQKIAKLLKSIEKEHNIKILFAIENGSRAWGMDSKDSDYDVRFVFYRPLENYVTLDKPSDVITAAFDENLQSHDVQGSLIDMCGFDIHKYLKLLASSNPTTIEWLHSPIVYLGDNNIGLKSYMNSNFSQEKLFHHYFSLFQNNYKLYIRDGKEITYKKYLYSMRGLLNALYVLKFDKIPPLLMRDTLQAMQSHLPEGIASKLNEVIEIKSQGLEKETVLRIPEFDEFFKEELAKTYNSFNKRKVDRKVFDFFLKERLGLDIKESSTYKKAMEFTYKICNAIFMSIGLTFVIMFIIICLLFNNDECIKNCEAESWSTNCNDFCN